MKVYPLGTMGVLLCTRAASIWLFIMMFFIVNKYLGMNKSIFCHEIKKILHQWRLEITAFRLWVWCTAHCLTDKYLGYWISFDKKDPPSLSVYKCKIKSLVSMVYWTGQAYNRDIRRYIYCITTLYKINIY